MTRATPAALAACLLAAAVVAAAADARPATAVAACSSSEVRLGLQAARQGDDVLVSVSLVHFRGSSSCRLAGRASVSLLTKAQHGTLLSVRGNPARGLPTKVLAPKSTTVVAFLWSNWCGGGRSAAVNGTGPFGGGLLVATAVPRCTKHGRPWVLALDRS